MMPDRSEGERAGDQVGLVAGLLNDLLHTRAHLWRDVGIIVDDTGDRRARNACQISDFV